MASIISKSKSGSKGYYVIDGDDALLGTLEDIYMAKRNRSGQIEASFNNKAQASEIESAVDDANAKAISNPDTKKIVNRYVELLSVAEKEGLDHGKTWIASERDIDVHQLDPWVGGEAVCYVYNK